jgi:V8-like Glu-specific endopeptidase
MRLSSLLPGIVLAVGGLTGLPRSEAVAQNGTAGTAAPGAGVRVHLASGVRTEVPLPGTLRDAKAKGAPSRLRPGLRPSAAPDRDETTFRPRKVFGADDRYPIADPTAYPWSTVCKVISEFPDGSVAEGSAVLIGDRFALTAGHVVFDDAAGGFAEVVEVVPASDGGDAPFGVARAADVTSFSGWTRDGDYDWDFALLRLDAAVGDEAGWLGLAAYSDADLTGLTVNTGGFPGDLDDGAFMFGATGEIERVLPGQLQMRGAMDAAGGQSGSGVWVRRERATGVERYVVGVISTETSTWNQAARVTGDVFDALSAWMDETTGSDFVMTRVAAQLPGEFEAPLTGRATVTVANTGDTGALTDVALHARDVYGARRLLARRAVFVPAFGEAGAAFDLSFGGAFPPGTWTLEAEANGDGAAQERDRDDNRRDGARFVVLPPFESAALGVSRTTVLDPGGVARFRVDVPQGLRAVRLQLAGARGAFATVTRPDGTRFSVPASRRVVAQRFPAAGAWLVDVRVPEGAPRAKTMRFLASPRF